MANSNERKPFRPLGLRLLNLSRQIIQTYAATDPIAREMLPRALEEPNYEPLSWDDGDGDSFADDQQWQTSETEDYGSMFPDLQAPRQSQRSQPSQPVQRKTQQPSQPSKPAENPHRLVDVGGVKVPAHVVQAMRNHQVREAQKEQNKQKLVDQSNQSNEGDSILAKRQQRGRGMSVDYLTTDVLRKDDEQSSSKPTSASSSDSDDSESHPETPTSNSPPVTDAPIMREMDSDAPQYADYDDNYDESFYQTAYPVDTDFVDNAPVASNQPSIQRTYDTAPYDDLAVDYSDDYADDSSYSESAPDAGFDAPSHDAPKSRTSRQQPSIQRTPDAEDANASALYSDFEPDTDTDFDASMSETSSDMPVSRNPRSPRTIQRTPDAEDANASALYSDFEPDTDTDFDAATGEVSEAPISRNPRNPRSIQRDLEQNDSDLYNDFEVEADVEFDAAIGEVSEAPISRSTRNPRSIQRDFEQDDNALSSDFEVEADVDFDAATGDISEAPISRSSRNPRSIQRDFEQDDNDLYSDFDAATGDISEAPISRNSRQQPSIQRTADFDEADDNLYDDFASEADSDFDATANSGQPAPIQRETDFEAVDANFFELGGSSPPLSRPVIGKDYYDNALQTDRMRAITDADIAAYDNRQSQSPTQSSQPTIQRSPAEVDDDDGDYDDNEYDDSGDQPDLHEALFAAGAVDTPPASFGKRIQRSPSLYDDLTPDDADSDYNPEQGAAPSLYDDFTPDNGDTGHAAAQPSIQRSPDDEEDIGSGNLQSDLLSLMGLSPTTKVAGFDDVFGSSSKSGNQGSNTPTAPMIQRTAEPPPAMVQRELTSSSSSESAPSSTSPSSTTDEGEKQKIEDMAQKVYKNLKQRLRIEWERRNRF